jgi:outer membrane protein assembly factor BamB
LLRADDWAGWLGNSRDGIYRETGIVDQIPTTGLPIKWRKPIAGGYAGPAVSNGKVFVFDYQRQSGEAKNDPGLRAKLSGSERLSVLDAKSGETLWQYTYDRPYEISYPSGPRATPTIDGDHVYLLGAEGDLTCLNVADGTLVWQRHLPTDFAAEVPIWGFASHPLVDGDLLYTMVGGKGQGIVAFEKATGKVRWKALDVNAGYCAPQIIQAGGTRQLIVFHPEGVQSLDPSTGASHWSVAMKPSYEMSIAQPIVEGDFMYASSIHTEAVMIRLGKESPTAEEVWRGEAKNAVHCSNAPPTFVDGVVYGTDCLQGTLIAVDAKNGDRIWETFQATKPDEKRFIKHGTAFITRLGESNRYLVFSENGDLILAEMNPKGFTEHGRMHVVDPTNESFGRPVVWSHPAYAEQTAFIRNDTEIVAVDLAE